MQSARALEVGDEGLRRPPVERRERRRAAARGEARHQRVVRPAHAMFAPSSSRPGPIRRLQRQRGDAVHALPAVAEDEVHDAVGRRRPRRRRRRARPATASPRTARTPPRRASVSQPRQKSTTSASQIEQTRGTAGRSSAARRSCSSIASSDLMRAATMIASVASLVAGLPGQLGAAAGAPSRPRRRGAARRLARDDALAAGRLGAKPPHSANGSRRPCPLADCRGLPGRRAGRSVRAAGVECASRGLAASNSPSRSLLRAAANLGKRVATIRTSRSFWRSPMHLGWLHLDSPRHARVSFNG